MGNNNYYSDNASVYGCNMNGNGGYSPANSCGNDNHDKHDDCDDNNHREERECCGKRFNNRPSKNDKKVQRALEAFEKQLANTDDAVDCLNKLFNCLEDAIFEDRCCLSNRIKNILRSIQTEICDLQDDIRNIGDDIECLEQAL